MLSYKLLIGFLIVSILSIGLITSEKEKLHTSSILKLSGSKNAISMTLENCRDTTSSHNHFVYDEPRVNVMQTVIRLDREAPLEKCVIAGEPLEMIYKGKGMSHVGMFKAVIHRKNLTPYACQLPYPGILAPLVP
jgi:hypothetical protein